MEQRTHWLVIVGAVAARDAARTEWRGLRIAADLLAPRDGDRVVVAASKRPHLLGSTLVVASADVRRGGGAELVLRHRIVAPAGHEVRLAGIPHLVVATTLTDARVAGALGVPMRITREDYARVEDILRERALEFGPPPSRRPHDRPRTPGRRRLATARILARSVRSRH